MLALFPIRPFFSKKTPIHPVSIKKMVSSKNKKKSVCEKVHKLFIYIVNKFTFSVV